MENADPGLACSAGLPAARWAASIWLLSGMLYIFCEAVSAAAFPHYSYARNYISDLGVPETGLFQGHVNNSPLHAVMNFGFIARGAMFILASLLIARGMPIHQRRIFSGLALLHGTGGMLVGLIPASPSSAAASIPIMHELGALLAITSGNAILIYGGLFSTPCGASRSYRIASVAAGILGFTGFILLLVNIGFHRPILFDDGVWERLSVYTIIAWTTVTGILILVRTRVR